MVSECSALFLTADKGPRTTDIERFHPIGLIPVDFVRVNLFEELPNP